MHPKNRVPDDLNLLLDLQAGVVSAEQARAHGFPREAVRRLLREERWIPVATGIYRRPEATTWLADAWAGVLLGGDGAVLGGLAAGHLNRLWPDAPDLITVWTGERRVRRAGPWDFRRGERVGRYELPRVSPEIAVLEAVADVELDAALSLTFSALQSRRVAVKPLLFAFQRSATQRHRKDLIDMLSDGAQGVESLLELRYLRGVERAHRLPLGTRQASFSSGTRSDVGYEEYGVIVELDGRKGHEGQGRFRDAQRDNRHTLAGHVTLRFGWGDVAHDPCRVAAIVATALHQRGWGAVPGRCRRCR